MSTWQTTMILNYSTGKIVTNPISIKKLILHHSLICLILFYMDDLKSYATNDEQLESLLHTVKMFRDYIKMQFRLDKCAKQGDVQAR